MLGAARYDLAVIDERLPGITGIETYGRARDQYPDLLALLITGFASFDSALNAYSAGFAHYLEKPFLPTTLAAIVDRLLTVPDVKSDGLQATVGSPSFFGMVGKSPAMRRLYSQISRAAQCEDTVLIQGETGTGVPRI